STSALVFSNALRLSRYAVHVGVCVSAFVVSSSSTWAIIAIRSLTTRLCSIKRSMIEYASRACWKSRSSAIRSYNRIDSITNDDACSISDIFITNITEPDASASRRNHCRSHTPDLLIVCGSNDCARLNMLISLETQSRQFLCGMSPMLYPDDDLLTNVAALREAHRIVEIGFGNDVSFIHVLSKARYSGFDAQDLEGVFTDWLCACGFESLLELSFSRGVGNDIETIFTRVTRAHYAYRSFYNTITWEFRHWRFKNLLHRLGCFFPLNAQQRSLTRHIRNLEITGEREPRERLQHSLVRRSLRIDQKRRLTAAYHAHGAD